MTHPDPLRPQHPSGFHPPTGGFAAQPPTAGFPATGPAHPPTGGFPSLGHGYPHTGGFPAAGPVPPGLPPAPPPPRKKGLSTGGIVAIVVGSLVALCCVSGTIIVATSDDKPDKKVADEQPAAAASAGAGQGGTGSAAAKPPTTKPTTAAPAKTSDVAAAGSAVRDGKFEFKVTKGPDCGKTQIGSQKAQGRFCQITLSIKNVGNDARTFDDSNVYGYNAAGARFESDGVAGIYANPNGEAFLNNINPGSQVSAVIVFDVAADVKLVSLEVHDSVFSRGAKVALG